MSFLVTYLPLNFPAVYALDKLGLRSGILIGITLNVVGMWIRCLINVHFTFAVVG